MPLTLERRESDAPNCAPVTDAHGAQCWNQCNALHAQHLFEDLHSKPLWAFDGVTVVFMSRAGVAGLAKLTAVQQDAILQPGEDLLERDKSQKHEQRSPCPKRTA